MSDHIGLGGCGRKAWGSATTVMDGSFFSNITCRSVSNNMEVQCPDDVVLTSQQFRSNEDKIG